MSLGETKRKHYYKWYVFCYLDRAGHGAEGEHSSRVLYGGLAVKCSLSVNEEYSDL